MIFTCPTCQQSAETEEAVQHGRECGTWRSPEGLTMGGVLRRHYALQTLCTHCAHPEGWHERDLTGCNACVLCGQPLHVWAHRQAACPDHVNALGRARLYHRCDCPGFEPIESEVNHV